MGAGSRDLVEGLVGGESGCGGAGGGVVEAVDGDEEAAGTDGGVEMGERGRRDCGWKRERG